MSNKIRQCDGVTSKNNYCTRAGEINVAKKWYCWQHVPHTKPLVEKTVEDYINLNIELKPDQKAAVEHLLTHRGLICMYKPGQGKTLIAVSSMHCLLSTDPTLTVVFISPVTLLANFVKEIKKYGLDINKKPLKGRVKMYGKEAFYSMKKKEESERKANITLSGDGVVNDQKVIGSNVTEVKDVDVSDKQNVFLILDECHHYRNSCRKKTSKSKQKGIIAKCIIDYAKTCKKVLLLSATPVKNDQCDIINLITMVSDTPPPSDAYFNKVIMAKTKQGEHLFNNYFGCKVCIEVGIDAVTHKKEDPDFAKLVFVDEKETTFVMSDQYYERYLKIQKAIEDEYLVDLYGPPEKYKIFYGGLRKASLSLEGPESPKILWTVNKLIEESNDGRRSIAFSFWLDSGIYQVSQLLTDMDVPYALITGSVNLKEREKAVLSYNRGDIKILLLSSAGGEGLDLMCTRNVILMERSWSPSDDDQVIGRARRYKSHSSLSPEERFINVYKLSLVKPSVLDPSDDLDSIDGILDKMCKDVKKPIIEELMNRLGEVSILNRPCSCGVKEETK